MRKRGLIPRLMMLLKYCLAKRIWKVLSFSNPCESSSLELVFIDEKKKYPSKVSSILQGYWLIHIFLSACDRHVFHVIPRFRVKLEVTNGKSTGVFVLFDSDMSYIMEKSCSFFVAQSKAKNSGPHPIEFDSLVGHKMLFVVDTSSKQPAVSDGSYRVKRVCMDPTINRSFGAKCPFFSPSKVISNAVDVDSDDDFYDEVGSDVSATVKRNLTKVFDKVVRGQKSVALKKVKIEKE
ncbi:replication protein A 70 kDa DNA-binding subunit E [Trifolium repens]|nr:replication protein A 70 kDa DNA-binding subunit E [Trifolium repens]KAK2452321.1 replication protein A 70 kDa DNA-binding subunit E [Trifolium repens]